MGALSPRKNESYLHIQYFGALHLKNTIPECFSTKISPRCGLKKVQRTDNLCRK